MSNEKLPLTKHCACAGGISFDVECGRHMSWIRLSPREAMSNEKLPLTEYCACAGGISFDVKCRRHMSWIRLSLREDVDGDPNSK
jgi:hypothetical protein